MESGDSKKFFFYIVVVLIFVEILDTYTTLMLTVVPSKIIDEFLFSYPQNVAESIFQIAVAIATIGTYLVFLNQFMADKIGRKTLLAMTVFGMGIASFLVSISGNIIQYAIFLFFLYIFFSSDIWVIYINEETKPGKRAFWTNLILVGGVIGALLVPIFRSIFITETTSNWRGMTYFAILLAIPLGFLILFTFKETSKYIELKGEQLAKNENQNLLKRNLKNIFSTSHKKEFLSILIISFLVGLNYLFVNIGESYLANSSSLNDSEINIVVYAISFSVIIGYLFTGFIADKYGRRILLYFYSFLMPISILMVIIGANLQSGALFIVSIGASLANVSYWGLGVLVRIVTLEITPTNARGTGTGLKSLLGAIGITSGLLMSSAITLFFNLGLSFIIFSFLLLINIPLTSIFIKETKDSDLSLI
ncbi:MAG: MFS transporter [Promethearchaeota archaeon]